MADFATLAATARGIEPRAPLHQLALPAGGQSYAFNLDNDLIKLVTLTPGPGTLTIRVRYATDSVLEDARHVLSLSSAPDISADGLGLLISWRTPLIPGVPWPQIRKSRRF
jgi:hypothetical protein